MRESPQEFRRAIVASKHFAKLPDELVDAMLELMREESFEVSQKLIRQNDPGESLLVVLEGTARVLVRDSAGVRHEVGTVARSDVLGEMALVTGAPRSADVVAETPVRALALGASDFHDLARRHPELGVMLSHLIADRLGGASWDILGDKTLQGYRIVRCIGHGGMAVVYEAVEASCGRQVALKMMSHRLVYNPIASARFREEAEIGATLQHRNIVRLLARFSAYGTHFLVMEFCDGPGLDEVLNRSRPLPEEFVRLILGQLSQALLYVHERGLIHRDVKASNVRLTRQGLAKLMDFGLAKPTLEPGDRTETHELALVGTPSYMAPEQFDEQRLDHRVDIYALACLAYKLLAAKRPFTKTGIAGLILEKMSFTLPPREEIGLGISPEMHEFIESGMRPDREQRLASLQDYAGWAAPVDVAALEA